MTKRPYMDVILDATIKLSDGATVSGRASVALERIVAEIGSSLYDHPNLGGFDERTEYALKGIAKRAIKVLKRRPFGEKEHKEQITVYQNFIDYLEKKKWGSKNGN